MICFKVRRGPALGRQNREKSMVRLGLNFCLFHVTIRFLENFRRLTTILLLLIDEIMF